MPTQPTLANPVQPRPSGPRGPRRPPPRPSRHQLVLAGAVAAAQSAGLSLLAVMVLVLVGWATAADSDATATAAVTGALDVWLVGHLAEIRFPGGTFALAPLGLTAIPVALIHLAVARAGRVAAATRRADAATLAAGAATAYALLVLTAALLASHQPVRPDHVSAALGGLLVGLAGAVSGTLTTRARWLIVWHRLPALARLALPPAAIALLVLLGSGAVLAGGMLALNRDQAEALVRSLDAGPGGTLLLLLGCLLYVPNAAIWAAAVTAGPGFSVGAGTSVTVAGADLGPVPAFPLLAALPQEGGGGLAWAVTVVPVLTGVVAALAVRREAARRTPARAYPLQGWRADLIAAGCTGLATGTGAAVLAGLAAGPAGPGRLAEAGPQWWAVGGAVTLEVAVVCATTLLAIRARSRA